MAVEAVQTGITSIWTDKAERRFIAERVFDAPRKLVWKAWTNPDALAKWWGPQGWKTTNYRFELKPGGTWHYCMRGPDGAESWGKATYREIVEPERIVYYDVFSDADGKTVEGMPGALITMEFIEQGDRTKITSTAEYASAEEIDSLVGMGMVQGLTETWDRLAEYLEAAA